MVVAQAILSLGLPVRPFAWLYRSGVRLVLSRVMSRSVRSCTYVLPMMLIVCGVRFRVVICCLVCPLVVVLVGRGVLMGSVRVASIAYAVGSAGEITKLVFCVEVSFLGWVRM